MRKLFGWEEVRKVKKEGCHSPKESSSLLRRHHASPKPLLLRGRSGVISQKQAHPGSGSFHNKSSKAREYSSNEQQQTIMPGGVGLHTVESKNKECSVLLCLRAQDSEGSSKLDSVLLDGLYLDRS